MIISKRDTLAAMMVTSCLSFFGGRATSIFYLSSHSNGSPQQPFQEHHDVTLRNNQMRDNEKDADGRIEMEMHCTEHKDNMVDNSVCTSDDVEDSEQARKKMYNYISRTRSGNKHLTYSHSGPRQHLAVDVRNVDDKFLDSESHLLQFLQDFSKLDSSNLTHSYCHRASITGVSCIGATPHWHIVLLTSPASHELSLNIYDYGSGMNTITLMSKIQEIFAISKRNSTKSTIHWESRGISPQSLYADNEDEPSIQPNKESLDVFSEALVHPAMFAHPNPKRVAIVGGRDGGSLREVLKHHQSVNEVKMIQTNKQVVEVLTEFGIELNENDNKIIYDDETSKEKDVKIDLHYEDAVSWMEDYDGNAFDVIVVDMSTPSDGNPINNLRVDENFMRLMHKSLSPKGAVAIQLGMAPFSNDPGDQFTSNKWRSSMLTTLEKNGFGSIHVYEDGNCAFGGPVLFLVASKDSISGSRELWFRSSALLEIEIRKRMYVASKSLLPSLRYFDSGVMSNFFNPHKSVEIAFCRSIPRPESCSFDVHEKLKNVPLSNLVVRPSTIGDGSGRGVFTTVGIEKGSTIAKDARYVTFYPSATNIIFKYAELSHGQEDVYNYFEGYGWETDIYGANTFMVEKSILTFINHGCNGEFNTLALNTLRPDVTEQNATPNDAPVKRFVYDPLLDRRQLSLEYMLKARKDIKAGEELFCTYVNMVVEVDEWWDYAQALKRMCNKEEVGLITLSEREKNSQAVS